MGWDEKETRRPEWAGGVPLLLPDGQAWWFYLPEAVPIEVDGVAAVMWDWGLGEAENIALTDALYKVLRKFGGATEPQQRASVVLEMAWLWLARNYELTPDRFSTILNTGKVSEGLWTRFEGFVGRIGEAGQIIASAAA